MYSKIRVAMCDDAKFLCEGFGEQLEDFDEVEFVGAVYSAAECADFVRENPIDVLLLDIQMETERAGIEIIEELKEFAPKMKIIMLTSFMYDEYIFSAFANGADDYCEKTMPAEEIVGIIKRVYDGTNSLRPEILQRLVNKSRKIQEDNVSLMYFCSKISKLSTGEFELLRMLYHGNSYKDIATKKCIELESVRKMEGRLMKKLKIDNIEEFIRQMHTLKLFEFIDNMDS